MATPATLVRTAALEAMQTDAGLAGVQTFRQFPDGLDTPFVRLLRGSWQRESISKSDYAYTVTLEIMVVQPLQDTAAEDLDLVEDALDTLFLTKLSVSGFAVHHQYLSEATSSEAVDPETDAEMDIAIYKLFVYLT